MIVMVDFSLEQGFGLKKKEKNEIVRYGLYLGIISFVIAFFKHTEGVRNERNI